MTATVAFSPLSYAKLLAAFTGKSVDEITDEIADMYRLSNRAARHVANQAMDFRTKELDQQAVEDEHNIIEEDS